ncbi:MAG TPA: AAA family ATPase [Candidatus Nitrosocosmicus sp.]
MPSTDRILELIRVKKQLKNISNNHIKYLKSYLTNEGFFAVPHISHKEFDKTIYENAIKYGRLSTCFALMSLLKSSFTISDIEKQLQRKNIFKDFIDKLLLESSGWTSKYNHEIYDIFSTPFNLLLLKKIKDELHIEKIGFDNSYVQQAIQSIVKNLQENNYYFLNQGKRMPSAFITYYSIESLYEWYDEIEKFCKKDYLNMLQYKKLLESIALIFENVFLWARDKLFQQIAYYSANDLDKKDSTLAFYCMFIYKKYNTTYKKKISYSNEDYNKYIIKKMIDYLLGDKYSIENIWAKNDLIISTNDSSIYTFSLSILAEFFFVMDADEYENYFIDSVDKILEWIINNERKAESLQILPSSNRFGKYFGWLPIFIKNKIETNELIPYCYSTSLVFSAVLKLQHSLNRMLIPKIILDEFNGEYRNLSNTDNFNKLMDSVIYYQNEQKISVKKILYNSVLYPRLKNSRYLENVPTAICLYGPPGTGKTTIASTVAEVLGWSFIRIEPSAFVKNGVDKFAQRVGYVFECLKHLEKTVILFDELDEYIKKRITESDKDSQNTDFFNRLSTNIFLTEIDKLYKANKNIIYFIATNNIDNIDEAITRDDRIDFKIFIDYIYPKEMIGILEEYIDETIKTHNKSMIKTNRESEDKYKDLMNKLENEISLKSINYKKWLIFINNFIDIIENNITYGNEILNEIKDNFIDIDPRYLAMRKEQVKKNRIDVRIIRNSAYIKYGEFKI